MSFRHFPLVAIAMTLAVALPASTRAAGKAEFVIKFGSVVPDGTPWAEQLKATKKRVEKGSNGRIKMKLFLGGSIGGEVEMVRALRRGRIQGYGGTTASIAEGAGIPQFQLMELPFLFESFEEADFILDTVVYEDFKALLEQKGFVLGHWHENGWRNFASKTRPIHTLADIQGMKMRSQESPVHLAMYKALGAQAESIPVPEVLGALKTGMVDGFDNTTLFSAATGWSEGIKYFTISQHIYQPGAIVYSKKLIDKLPEDLRKLLLGDRRTEAINGRAGVRALQAELLQTFREAGIQVSELTDAQRGEFATRARTVHPEFEAVVGKDLLKKVRVAQAEYRAKHAASAAQ